MVYIRDQTSQTPSLTNPPVQMTPPGNRFTAPLQVHDWAVHGGFRKGIIIQIILTPTEVLPNGQSCLRKKGMYLDRMFMHPDREIVHMTRRSYGIYTRPDIPNTLTHQSSGTNDTPREPLHSPLQVHDWAVHDVLCNCVLYLG